MNHIAFHRALFQCKGLTFFVFKSINSLFIWICVCVIDRQHFVTTKKNNNNNINTMYFKLEFGWVCVECANTLEVRPPIVCATSRVNRILPLQFAWNYLFYNKIVACFSFVLFFVITCWESVIWCQRNRFVDVIHLYIFSERFSESDSDVQWTHNKFHK